MGCLDFQKIFIYTATEKFIHIPYSAKVRLDLVTIVNQSIFQVVRF